MCGSKALAEAAEIGCTTIVKTLLRSGLSADSQIKEEARTPLIIAAENGRVDVLNILLDAGAISDLRIIYNGKSYTPLAAAAKYGHIAIVARLLRINEIARCVACDSFVLKEVAKGGYVEVIKLFLELVPRDSDDKLKIIVLVEAAKHGQIELVRYLIGVGVLINEDKATSFL